MISRAFSARGISVLLNARGFMKVHRNNMFIKERRFFSDNTDSAPKVDETTKQPELAPITNEVSSVQAGLDNTENAAIQPAESVAESSATTTESVDVNLDNLLNDEFYKSIIGKIDPTTSAPRNPAQNKVAKLNVLLKDDDFKQMYNQLQKIIPKSYWNQYGSYIKQQFVNRICNYDPKRFYPSSPSDLSIAKDIREALTKDNTIIAEEDKVDETMSIPIPTDTIKVIEELFNKVLAQKEEKKEEKKEEEKKEEDRTFPAEWLDKFGEWPYDNTDEKEKPTSPMRNMGSIIRKNVIINKKGVRIAYGGGKRKDAHARVYIRAGHGEIKVNGQSLHNYFHMGNYRDQVLAPLAITETFQKFSILANVNGGGLTGQSESIRIALAKALIHYDPIYAPVLSKAGLLTADPRIVERKKPGMRKARRPQQWVKR